MLDMINRVYNNNNRRVSRSAVVPVKEVRDRFHGKSSAPIKNTKSSRFLLSGITNAKIYGGGGGGCGCGK